MTKKSARYFVYMLECGDGTYYTGITTDVNRRFSEHQKGIGARYTRSRRAMRIVFSEKHANRSSALKREAEIKSWDKKRKTALVETKAA